MKFKSYDSIQKQECETEITNIDANIASLFIQTWIPDYLYRSLKDPNFGYAIFAWDKIIKFSFVVGSPSRCYGAFTSSRLDGLLCLSRIDKIKIEYIATAPWNYYTIGKMRRIGSGLIFFTIRTSIYSGFAGEFFLNALPDAEKFYESIGMKATGNINKNGLKEYYMKKDKATAFAEAFKEYVISK